MVYVAVSGWALMVLGSSPWYGPYDYISLEGFPDVQILDTRKIDESWAEVGKVVPVTYSIVRGDYELRIDVEENTNTPSATVTVRSDRSGIGLLPVEQQVTAAWYACPSVTDRLSSGGLGGAFAGLVFDDACYDALWHSRSTRHAHGYNRPLKLEDIKPDERAMRFIVADLTGSIAEERIPYRVESGGLLLPRARYLWP